MSMGNRKEWPALRIHHQGDDARHAVPRFLLGFELFASGAGESVIFGPRSLVADAPLALEPPLRLHAIERGVKAPFLHAQSVLRKLFEFLGDAPAVEVAAREDAEHEHVERPLNQTRFFRHTHLFRMPK